MRPACGSIASWLAADESNVAVIHCKAGKGRTGLMIAAYLLHSGVSSTADAALALFAVRRTHDGKGVTIPSQQRFVRYYALQVRCSSCSHISYISALRPSSHSLTYISESHGNFRWQHNVVNA